MKKENKEKIDTIKKAYGFYCMNETDLTGKQANYIWESFIKPLTI